MFDEIKYFVEVDNNSNFLDQFLMIKIITTLKNFLNICLSIKIKKRKTEYFWLQVNSNNKAIKSARNIMVKNKEKIGKVDITQMVIKNKRKYIRKKQ